jgi:hypothetical protein
MSGSDLEQGLLFGGFSPPNKKITSLRPRRFCGEICILGRNGSLASCSICSPKIPLSFLDGRPEAEVHRTEDDQASPDMKRVEDSFEDGGNRIKRPVHLPESFLEFFDRHPFGLKNDGGHIILRPILCQKPPFLF